MEAFASTNHRLNSLFICSLILSHSKLIKFHADIAFQITTFCNSMKTMDTIQICSKADTSRRIHHSSKREPEEAMFLLQQKFILIQ